MYGNHNLMLHNFFLECFQYSLTGRLANGIVHNLNGPLQILSMQMEMIKMDLMKFDNPSALYAESLDLSSGGGALRDDIARINERLEQITEVIVRLESMIRILGYRGMSDDEEKQLKPVDMCPFLEDFIEFWNADLYFKHRVEKEILLPESSLFPVIDEAGVLAMLDGIMSGFMLCIKGMDGSSFRMVCSSVGRNGCCIELGHTGLPVPDEMCEKIMSLRNSYSNNRDGQPASPQSSDMGNNPELFMSLLLGAVRSVDAGWTFEISPQDVVISQVVI